MSNKIHSPFVLEFVLPYLLFPQQILQMRVVSKKWNSATRRALNNQMITYSQILQKGSAKLAQASENEYIKTKLQKYRQLEHVLSLMMIEQKIAHGQFNISKEALALATEGFDVTGDKEIRLAILFKKALKYSADSMELKAYIEKLKLPKLDRYAMGSQNRELVDYLHVKASMLELSFGIQELIALIHTLEEKQQWLEFVSIFLKKESWLQEEE